MHSNFLLPTALLATLSLAQSNDFNINTAEVSPAYPFPILLSTRANPPSLQESKVVADIENFATTLESSPAFKTDVAQLLSFIPSSLVAEAEASPAALLDALESDPTLPAAVSAIPTSVIASLETLAAVPIDAVDDVEDYLEALGTEAAVSAALSVLATAVPTSVQNALASDPASFLENLVTETALPSWVTDIPAPLQSEIGGVINEGLSIFDADFEGTAVSSGFVKATGTGSAGAGLSNATKPSTGPATPFVGGAASLRGVGAGVAALVAAVGFLIVL